mmetsp:Transcript_1860/g.4059  ORF Transcript_1860/g.4059 Transcript_1860/m.4059 type:complete len:228 (+) Transcript_1860:1311-1994(+)
MARAQFVQALGTACFVCNAPRIDNCGRAGRVLGNLLLRCAVGLPQLHSRRVLHGIHNVSDLLACVGRGRVPRRRRHLPGAVRRAAQRQIFEHAPVLHHGVQRSVPRNRHHGCLGLSSLGRDVLFVDALGRNLIHSSGAHRVAHDRARDQSVAVCNGSRRASQHAVLLWGGALAPACIRPRYRVFWTVSGSRHRCYCSELPPGHHWQVLEAQILASFVFKARLMYNHL